VEVAVSFLSGSTRQGRIGIGYSTLREAAGTPAADGSIELMEMDRALESLKTIQGSGSAGRKSELLKGIFSRATEDEQRFLVLPQQ
jgi:DNA ligase 1